MRKILCCLVLCFFSCSKNDSNSLELFLPKVNEPQDTELLALREHLCSPAKVSFKNGILSEENFRDVFNCVNYDGRLDPLRKLVESSEFPEIISHVNKIIGASSTKNLKERLEPWFVEDEKGNSKIDRLLPVVKELIENPAFQKSLPLLHSALTAGDPIWKLALPRLADLVYNPRFPDTFVDIGAMWDWQFQDLKEKGDAAKSIKKLARYLRSQVTDDETIAGRMLYILNNIDQAKPAQFSLIGYLDHANVKNVFVSLAQETGALRNEMINPDLNNEPDEEEKNLDKQLTPEERQRNAYLRLFRGGENAPIYRLLGIVHQFQQPHPQFVTALKDWFSKKEEKLQTSFFEFFAIFYFNNEAISMLNIDDFLKKYLNQFVTIPDCVQKLRCQVTADAFSAFVREAFSHNFFEQWLETIIYDANKKAFGKKNAELLKNTKLHSIVISLYRKSEVAAFAKDLFGQESKLEFRKAIPAFSRNYLEAVRFPVSFRDQLQNDWSKVVVDSLGESIQMKFVMQLLQNVLRDFSMKFASGSPTISEWYFGSTYSDPAATESMIVYLFKQFRFMNTYEKNKDWIVNDLAKEIFCVDNVCQAADLNAFRALANEIPSLYLYVRSGMARSGNDLSRALSEKDDGYLSNTFVQILSHAYETGFAAKALPLWQHWIDLESPIAAASNGEDQFKKRRRLSNGVDAMKRVLTALLEPEVEGHPETSLLYNILVPLESLVTEKNRKETETFILTLAQEILQTPDENINGFFSGMKNVSSPENITSTRETLKGVSELLKKSDFAEILSQLKILFDEGAVAPALKFVAQKIGEAQQDGSLERTLLFIRRVLGIQRL